MLANQGKASDVTMLLAPVEAADTTAATGVWTDTRHCVGDLVLIVNVGVVTAGSIVPSLRTASDGSGTGDSLMVPNGDEGVFTAVTTSNDPLIQKRTYDSRSSLGWVQFVGTITTGPAVVSSTLLAHPKYM